LILAVIVIAGARVRGGDLPSCSQEITRCLAACRAIASRRLAEHSRDAHMERTNRAAASVRSVR
jgi:hypothetical protein